MKFTKYSYDCLKCGKTLNIGHYNIKKIIWDKPLIAFYVRCLSCGFVWTEYWESKTGSFIIGTDIWEDVMPYISFGGLRWK